jgi:hypothetical protein
MRGRSLSVRVVAELGSEQYSAASVYAQSNHSVTRGTTTQCSSDSRVERRARAVARHIVVDGRV